MLNADVDRDKYERSLLRINLPPETRLTESWVGLHNKDVNKYFDQQHVEIYFNVHKFYRVLKQS
jgi:hypothetical protein